MLTPGTVCPLGRADSSHLRSDCGVRGRPNIVDIVPESPIQYCKNGDHGVLVPAGSGWTRLVELCLFEDVFVQYLTVRLGRFRLRFVDTPLPRRTGSMHLYIVGPLYVVCIPPER